uniref:Prolamin-like domain-containing protein n=1 Tax=Kalanchoe fedtschenkoi TaxID=63787 RepID=A0A7N0ULC6_KALFE
MSALTAFAVLCLALSIPNAEARALDNSGDPLASAPVLDYHFDPSADELVPESQPEPDVVFAPGDTDFPGFASKNKVIEFLKTCEETADLDLDCGVDFHLAVFYEDAKPADRCCEQVLKPGKQCHDVLVKFIYRFEGVAFDWNEVSRRSDNVWKHCSLIGKL